MYMHVHSCSHLIVFAISLVRLSKPANPSKAKIFVVNKTFMRGGGLVVGFYELRSDNISSESSKLICGFCCCQPLLLRLIFVIRIRVRLNLTRH
jgi:hypothetical protein